MTTATPNLTDQVLALPPSRPSPKKTFRVFILDSRKLKDKQGSSALMGGRLIV